MDTSKNDISLSSHLKIKSSKTDEVKLSLLFPIDRMALQLILI